MSKEEQVIAGFWNLFQKKMWLDEVKMKEQLRDYTPSELHCMEYVQEHNASNVTDLAEAFFMTRGAISKLTKKLIEKGLLESYRQPHNQKEVYFKLTNQGESVHQIHKRLHKEFQDRDKPVFQSVSEKQLDDMITFANAYNKHLDREMANMGINIRSSKYDKL